MEQIAYGNFRSGLPIHTVDICFSLQISTMLPRIACISSHEKTPRRIIRKAAKLATRYNTTFIALYVQTPKESMDRIGLARQRYLLNHFKLVTELGGEVVQVQSRDILGNVPVRA